MRDQTKALPAWMEAACTSCKGWIFKGTPVLFSLGSGMRHRDCKAARIPVLRAIIAETATTITMVQERCRAAQDELATLLDPS